MGVTPLNRTLYLDRFRVYSVRTSSIVRSIQRFGQIVRVFINVFMYMFTHEGLRYVINETGDWSRVFPVQV